MSTVLFHPSKGPYQELPLLALVVLGTIATKAYSTFPKAPALPLDYLLLYTGPSLGESYPSAEIQSVYYLASSPSWLGQAEMLELQTI